MHSIDFGTEKHPAGGKNTAFQTGWRPRKSLEKIRDDMTVQVKIWVSRIETVPDQDAEDFAQVTFRIHAGSRHLDFPVLVNKNEFDDVDLTKVARSILHESLAELANQTEKWKLTEEELRQLSSWKFYQGA